LAVLEDLSARTEQGGAGADEAPERDEVVFVAAGAVEEEERGRGAGFEAGEHQSFLATD
jgi:hypothetical protein